MILRSRSFKSEDGPVIRSSPCCLPKDLICDFIQFDDYLKDDRGGDSESFSRHCRPLD